MDSVSSTLLCRLDDVPEGDSAGFAATRPDGTRVGVVAVRKNGTVFAYVNSCPHTGAPLDLVPGQFLTMDKAMILCSTHGAIFRIEDGYCLEGPCARKSLTPVASSVEGGAIYLSF
ncbi:MAG: Rieske (2Fe-2S) protein [Alphaproteobacteria bacterium]|nr:Rieske (2Fe-2S) protein [Alphaproteobacteria bacterium]